MTGTTSKNDSNERRKNMNTEDNILRQLTEILEKEHLITIEERNRTIEAIEGGNII